MADGRWLAYLAAERERDGVRTAASDLRAECVRAWPVESHGVCARVRVWVCTGVCVCLRVRAHACDRVCVCACVRVCVGVAVGSGMWVKGRTWVTSRPAVDRTSCGST